MKKEPSRNNRDGLVVILRFSLVHVVGQHTVDIADRSVHLIKSDIRIFVFMEPGAIVAEQLIRVNNQGVKIRDHVEIGIRFDFRLDSEGMSQMVDICRYCHILILIGSAVFGITEIFLLKCVADAIHTGIIVIAVLVDYFIYVETDVFHEGIQWIDIHVDIGDCILHVPEQMQGPVKELNIGFNTTGVHICGVTVIHRHLAADDDVGLGFPIERSKIVVDGFDEIIHVNDVLGATVQHGSMRRRFTDLSGNFF